MKHCLLLLGLLFTKTGFAKTWYVAQLGNDRNSGDRAHPFQTIQRGADAAQPGDTVLVSAGVYRERVAPPRGGTEGHPIVYMAVPGAHVIIKGSDNWQPDYLKITNAVYYAIPDASMFNDDCYRDGPNPFRVPLSSTPYGRNGRPEFVRAYPGSDSAMIYNLGQVFVDGEQYRQTPYRQEMEAGAKTWFYERATGALFIHFTDDQPARHQVEITTRRRIFAPHKRQLGHIVVQGFIMEHCGNQYPTNFWEAAHPEWQQAGAIGTRSGHHWVIKRNVIRLATGIGIDFGNEGDEAVDLETGTNGLATGATHILIDSNYIIDNGGAGTAAYNPTYITFTNNVVERNNYLLFTGKKRWESAGVKMHHPDHSIISHNLIRNNYDHWGLWLDQGSGEGTIVHGNLIIGHQVGFDLEIGTARVDKMIFDNNILIDNATGIGSREAGGITALNNLIIRGAYGVRNTINHTRTGNWSSDHQHYFNNVFLDNKIFVSVCPPGYHRSADRRFDHNIYVGKEAGKKFEILHRAPTAFDLTQWQDTWKAYNQQQNADVHSTTSDGITYRFDSTALLLTVQVNGNMQEPRTASHPALGVDYYGHPIPAASTALPGPFQQLQAGVNQLKLWNGLPPLAKYALPALRPLPETSARVPAADEQRLAWWHDAKFGMFIHWGVYALWAGNYNGHEQARGGAEWIMNRCKIPVATYQQMAKTFNPVNYDPDAWVKMAKHAGMKYIIITAKHHDGFALFDSKASNWDVVDATVYGKDLLKPLAAACEKYGIRLGFYYSQAQDWNNPGGTVGRKLMSEGWPNPDSALINAYTKEHHGHWDPAQETASFEDYIDRVAVPQVRELLTNYGTVSVLWWDTPVGMTDAAALKLQQLLALQPAIITNDRLKSHNFPGDTKTPEQYIPEQQAMAGLHWETCMTMNNTCGYRNTDTNWKSTETLVRNLLEIVSKGGNYLLNIGPRADGSVPEASVDRLKAIGDWMQVNSEAIHGTAASPFGPLPWGCCTRKEGKRTTTLYLSVFDWPADGQLVLPGLSNPVIAAKILSTGKRVTTKTTKKGLALQVSGEAPDKIATVIKLEVKGTVASQIANAGKQPFKSGALD